MSGGEWYAEAVRWAAGEGIVNGVSETEFAPNAAVTREQLAAILHRYAQHKGYDVSIGESTNILSYSDFASISEYAISAMQWVCGEGIITGVTESKLEPQGLSLIHIFALIVCLSFAMPGITGRLAEWSCGAYGAAASIFTGSSTLGYIIIGLLAFVLGIFVTILCFKLRSLGGRDGDDNGRDN